MLDGSYGQERLPNRTIRQRKHNDLPTSVTIYYQKYKKSIEHWKKRKKINNLIQLSKDWYPHDFFTPLQTLFDDLPFPFPSTVFEKSTCYWFLRGDSLSFRKIWEQSYLSRLLEGHQSVLPVWD